VDEVLRSIYTVDDHGDGPEIAWDQADEVPHGNGESETR